MKERLGDDPLRIRILGRRKLTQRMQGFAQTVALHLFDDLPELFGRAFGKLDEDVVLVQARAPGALFVEHKVHEDVPVRKTLGTFVGSEVELGAGQQR